MNGFNFEYVQEMTTQILVRTHDMYNFAEQIKKKCQQFLFEPLTFEDKVNLYFTLLESVFLEPEQKELFFSHLSTIVCENVPLSQFVVNGCFIRAAKKWQLKNKKPIIIMLIEPRVKQYQIGSEILEETTQIIGRLIAKFPNKEIFLQSLYLKLIDAYDEFLSLIRFKDEFERASVELTRLR